MSNSKPASRDNVLKKAFKAYVQLLHSRPVFTKSCTSATLGGLGCLISQLAVKNGQFKPRTIAAYMLMGFMFVGPTTHHFYIWLDQAVPRTGRLAAIKRIILDRFIFAPPWLMVYFYVLALLEGHGITGATKKLEDTLWTAVKMNWKMWTPFQFVNVNYVPNQYRVPVMSIMALIWTVYVATMRSS